MSSMFVRTIKQYMKFQALKFIAGLWLFYLIFQKLDIENYAIYGIVQSFVILSSLFIGFNVKSSFQKLYSKKYLVKSINLIIFLIVLISSFFYTVLYITFMFDIVNFVFKDTENTPDLFLLYIYILSFGLTSIVSSMLNANRRTFLFGISTVLPALISIPSLIYLEHVNINNLIIILMVSNLVMIFFIAISNLKVFYFSNYSRKYAFLVLKYIIGYSWLSFPTLSSKYSIDVFARSILLTSIGELAVAVLTFSTSLFSIFRSVEQAFFKAITPLLLLNKKNNLNQLSLVRKLILFQSIFTIIIFSFAPYWVDFLKLIFSTKPDEAFVPIVLFIMACSTATSYIKNYFLSQAKKHSSNMRKFFVIATIMNLCILAVLLIVNLSVIKFVLIQLLFSLINLLFVKLFIKL
jgi:hypothetical protein